MVSKKFGNHSRAEHTDHENASHTYLNITHLSELRIDAHPSIYTINREGKPLSTEERQQPIKYGDCSHWCLPGLPDTWNVLLLASLRIPTL
ncbi:hypothetical protein PR202_gb25955 [Eleusine coracana subsp. coracana]|uniref:Trichome birefringence-like C-terminal domain-containing protein n=1 Tax=Eleusine coracana subsp. coracana TaxID=191504 RepID=A0AAV5FRZ3_ELECO|nr:hypothetical protein PR202_gb25955 [Eleusine coracana subsp. coracana]